MSNGQQEVDKLYKSHFGKMVAAMLRFSRELNLEMAEDIVQDAFYSALTNWNKDGLPENAAGWIYKVCRNKAINFLKKNKKFSNPFEIPEAGAAPTELTEYIFEDEQLRLLFACANARLSAKAQVIITLKYVVNLRVESIAKALGMTVDGIDKQLIRARQKIKLENIFLKEPPPQALRPRLPVVHKIIYLVFNEGYKASSGKDLIREELCEDALLMTRTLLQHAVANSDTAALYALLLFNAARLHTRFTVNGQLSDLEEQDRNLWNSDLIALGTRYLRQSRTEIPTSYHYEAAIAYLHCVAGSFAVTDWVSITQLYRQLLKKDPSPFIQLNYAIALYYASQKEEAFSMLHQLEESFLKQYSLLHAALGKLYVLEGKMTEGKQHLQLALSLTTFGAEKDFILKMIGRDENTGHRLST